MLFVAEPFLGPEEQAAAASVIASGWLTLGSRVREFEQAFARRHDVEEAVAVNSCTAALHLALAALGIGPGDEVLVPSLTFVATVNAILYVGARPVLVDIEALNSPLIALADAEAKLTPRTRAVMLMHFAGHLAAAEPWQRFAARHGLLLIEDAAHAVGVDGVGRYGDAAAFSFYGNKNMTTGEGGMVLTRQPDLLERARQMRGHGMTRSVTAAAGRPLAALRRRHARVQLPHGRNPCGDRPRAARPARGDECPPGRLVAAYDQRLRPLEEGGLCIPRPRSGVSAHHIMPVLLPRHADRDAVGIAMQDAGIQTTIHYPPVHTLSFYRGREPELRLPLTEEFHRRELTLPLHPAMADADVDRVADALERALAASREQAA